MDILILSNNLHAGLRRHEVFYARINKNLGSIGKNPDKKLQKLIYGDINNLVVSCERLKVHAKFFLVLFCHNNNRSTNHQIKKFHTYIIIF